MNPEDALLEFAAGAAGESADEMQTIIDQRIAKVYRDALEVYYAAEELARDPANAHLIPTSRRCGGGMSGITGGRFRRGKMPHDRNAPRGLE